MLLRVVTRVLAFIAAIVVTIFAISVFNLDTKGYVPYVIFLGVLIPLNLIHRSYYPLVPETTQEKVRLSNEAPDDSADEEPSKPRRKKKKKAAPESDTTA